MRNLVLALLISGGIAMGAASQAGPTQAAVISNSLRLAGAAQADNTALEVAHRRVHPRFGIYFGFHVGPRYWYPGPYYYHPYPRYYLYPYYDVPRYYRRCWRIKPAWRLVCRLYRRW
jgi:hypothetical protein